MIRIMQQAEDNTSENLAETLAKFQSHTERQCDIIKAVNAQDALSETDITQGFSELIRARRRGHR